MTAYVVPLVLLALMLAAALGSRMRTDEPRSRLFLFLRVLFPSWRFFDRADASPVLWVRSAAPLSPWSEFERVSSLRTDGVGAVFVNAQGNLLLAYHSLCEQLVSDLSELESDASDAARALVSYELVSELARQALAQPEPGTRFQFRLQTEASDTAQASVLVTSEIHVL